MNTFLKASALALSLALVGSTAAKAADTVNLQLAHDVDLKHSGHRVSEYFAKELEKISGGKMTVSIYPSGQMGSTRELMEILPSRGIDMTYISANGLESFADIYSVLTLPYMFESKEHFNKVVYGDVGKEIMASTKDKGFVAIGAYAAGSRSFYTKAPLKSIADIKGKKIRVPPSPTLVATVKAIGGLPTPIAFAESYTAIQQGVVDGAENNIPSFVSTRHFEVAKNYIEDEHSSFPDYMVIATETLDSLTDEQKGWLFKVAEASQVWQKKQWEAMEVEDRKTAEEAGVTFTKVDKAPFVKAVQPIVDDFTAKHPEYQDLLKRIKALAH